MSNSNPEETEGSGVEAPVPTHEEMPVFPFVPDSIKESRFHVIEAGDLKTDADVSDLMKQMWLFPEEHFFHFYGHMGGPAPDGVLLSARNRGDILMDESERRYYKHPKFQRDYVRIVPNGEQYNWDWQRDVVEKGPEFWRVTLKLSARKRDEMDAWRKVQMEEHFRQQARQARYAYDVFLSYAGADTSEAQSLHDKIVAADLKVFMAPKVLKPGDDFAEEIRMALLGSRELWLLVSPSSSSSEWVISEWGAAWALGKRIVPILHRCGPESLPARIQKLQCIDLYRSDELIRSLREIRE
jgi:hypothetical protein